MAPREGLSETASQSVKVGRACAAPTGLGSSREHVPTASAVGYGVSSLAGLRGDAMKSASGLSGDATMPASLREGVTSKIRRQGRGSLALGIMSGTSADGIDV